MPPIAANNLSKKISGTRSLHRRWVFFVLVFMTIFFSTVFMTMFFSTGANAALKSLQDQEMETVYGRAGIIITPKNIQIFNHIDSIYFINNDGINNQGGSYIEFQDFQMHGNGDVARFNYDFGTTTKSGMMFFDVAEPEVAPPVRDWSAYAFGTSATIHRGMSLLRVPEWDQELGYSVGNISLYDPTYPTVATAAPVDLGSFDIGLIDIPRFYTYTSVRTDGTGVDWEHDFQMTIDHIAYAYNTACDKITFGPIYMGETFSDLGGDDPRFPATWKPNQSTPVDFGEFQIGDLFGVSGTSYSNPASMDVGEADFNCDGNVLGALQLRLPMEGSLRFESATFAGTDFGPGAIDGIHVYRLNMFLIP